MFRKIGCNRNFRNRVNKTEFGRIVLNLIFYKSALAFNRLNDAFIVSRWKPIFAAFS